jgi:hypothetical protein
MKDYNTYIQQLLMLKQKEIKLSIELKKVNNDIENLSINRLKDIEQKIKSLNKKS